MTLNVAMAHFDATRAAHGQRLVYGGHTIALAADQAARARAGPRDDPRLARRRPHRRRCSRATRCARASSSSARDGPLVHLRSQVTAVERAEHVLDWRFVGVMP